MLHTTAIIQTELGIHMRIFASCQCADYVHTSYADSGEACMACVTFAVEAVSHNSPSAPSSRPPSPSSKNAVIYNQLHVHLSESSISECVRLCDAHMAYVRNDILHDIPESDPPCTYVRTYVHMYFVRIDPQFRASH